MVKKKVNPNKIPLSRRFISWLFRHYDIVEYVTHFYDDEPHDIDEMLGFPGEDVHWWDSAAGRAAAYPIFRAYEEYRMTFCNWVDVITQVAGWTLGRKRINCPVLPWRASATGPSRRRAAFLPLSGTTARFTYMPMAGISSAKTFGS